MNTQEEYKVAKFCGIEPHTFEHNGKEVEIKSIQKNGGLLLVVASYNGIEDSYYFQNPPIMHEGKEDLLEVLHVILGDAITLSK